MDVQRLASFTRKGQGGNPAGVVLCDTLPDVDDMQDLAHDVGYSETVFAAPMADGRGRRTRYFAPQAEVPFCGHATIALGAALGAAHGAGEYALVLNDTQISVTAYQEDGVWGAQLTSPRTSHAPVPKDVLADVLALFGLEPQDLDPAIPPAMVNGGAQHMVLALARHGMLQAMQYEFSAGAKLMRSIGLVTINLIWRETAQRFHSRNAFAGHGVYEDPATGAAAAALAGYLRDALGHDTPFEVMQGQEAGHPSRLCVAAHAGANAPVDVSGTVRHLSGR
ncbi:MAG: PhzF family phenazine biosynthesis protein [Roseovarius sp.]